MDFEDIILRKEGKIAKIIINRPEVMNAASAKTKTEIMKALELIEHDAEVRVVVITGSGEKAFSAGADLRLFQRMTMLEAHEYVKVGRQLTQRIESFPKPVIAAVNGFALGGGMELAMACDIIIATRNAKFGQTEINLALIPGQGGSQRLPRSIGIWKAKELLMTGKIIPAEEAESLGFVNKVVPSEKLDDEINELAGILAEKSPVILALVKDSINKSRETALPQGLDYESQLFVQTFATEDQKEGIGAFLEKRKPSYKGR